MPVNLSDEKIIKPFVVPQPYRYKVYDLPHTHVLGHLRAQKYTSATYNKKILISI